MSILAVTAIWLTSLGIPVQTPPVVVEPMPPSISGFVANGAIHTDSKTLKRWKEKQDHQLLLHEMTHVASFQAGHVLDTIEKLAIEEGIAQAVEDDLGFHWLRKFPPTSPTIFLYGSAYPKQANWIRKYSSLKCNCPWQSRDARRERWKLVSGDRTVLSIMSTPIPLDKIVWE